MVRRFYGFGLKRTRIRLGLKRIRIRSGWGGGSHYHYKDDPDVHTTKYY